MTGGEPMGEGETVVASFSARPQAEIARGFLEDAGIRSALVVDDAGTSVPGVSIGFAPARVLVRSSDIDRAREVLRDAGMLDDDGGA